METTESPTKISKARKRLLNLEEEEEGPRGEGVLSHVPGRAL